ncbi:hypothetical protein NX781_09675 [Lactobacillus kullabergensis]|uniref:hypothetical protein n=1 Tax=Lactobacillus kullabergensis TaxID=1218493 RepID=UPI0022464C7F|nr:hypothetical protein [Lactobacillus kullabergensis]MCX0292063.1 hypothetical protein [Lactobacillus kullabergensis]
MTNFDVELYASQVDLTLESGDNKVIVIRGASGTKIYKDVKKVTGQKISGQTIKLCLSILVGAALKK